MSIGHFDSLRWWAEVAKPTYVSLILRSVEDTASLRQHADGSLAVKDLGSMNGIYIGDRKVKEAILMPGDVVQWEASSYELNGPMTLRSTSWIAAPFRMSPSPNRSRSSRPDTPPSRSMTLFELLVGPVPFLWCLHPSSDTIWCPGVRGKRAAKFPPKQPT